MKETQTKTDGHTWLSEWSRLCPEGLSRGPEGKGRRVEERATLVTNDSRVYSPKENGPSV